jgi:thiosulfate/3-mercaptopyruvate sulfurtransferase
LTRGSFEPPVGRSVADTLIITRANRPYQSMSISPLITAEELDARLSEASLRIFDCRFSLREPELGRQRYREGHIPGAFYAHLDQDLSRLDRPHAGRHPLPEAREFRDWLAARGVGADTTVVCYDDVGGGIAARFWWMARWLGITDNRMLDGGLDAWVGAGHALDTGEPDAEPCELDMKSEDEAICGIKEVESFARGETNLILLDARDERRFSGQTEPLDPVAGHIPGARNAPFSGNLGADKRFLEPRLLRDRFIALLGVDAQPDTVVHSCGSGVTACHNLLAMEIAGLSGSRLFPGSWSQWVDDPARPVATGRGGDGV